MAVQQCKVSKTQVRNRKGANRYRGLKPGVCPMCGAPRMPHRVCRSCGNYGDRQVITVKSE